MSDTIVVKATLRNDLGKGASRRLRRHADLMPAIVYGGKKKPAAITVEHKEMLKFIENEAFFSSVLALEINGKAERVILKDLQRHPAKRQMQHADFQRISKDTVLHINVPLHFINEASCIGVKQQGGKIQHTRVELEISCTPDALPEFIEVDMANVEKGQTLHISDLQLPEGVTSVQLALGEAHDLPVASIITPKSGEDIAEAATDDSDTEASGDGEATASDD